MGRLDKVVLKFPHVFWPRSTTTFGFVSQTFREFPEFLNGFKLTGEPILLAFAAAGFARQLETLPDAEVQAKLMTVVRTMFGAKSPDPIGMKYSRWGKDPFAGGCYSYVPVGATSELYDVMAKPIDKLFFAGEATSRDYRATVHGAFLSGLREAKRVKQGLAAH